jgi:hypothetical protein
MRRCCARRRTPAQFENELRQAFMLEAIASPVSLAAFPSNTSMTQIARLVAQQREIAWADLRLRGGVAGPVTPGCGAVRR